MSRTRSRLRGSARPVAALDGSATRGSEPTAMPEAALNNAATPILHCRPSVGTRKNPAATQPAAAPPVFTP